MPHKLSLWLGSQSSYEASIEASAKAEARMNAGEEPASLPPLLEVQGSVGIISIQGSLVPENAGWGLYFGQCGYSDIRDALTAALLKPEVTSILLNMASGGGAVAGCHETAQLIRRVNKVKPVVTYAGATMGSACLWLGVSGRKIYGAETAEIGSLGIIMVHADKSEMLEKAGIKVTVIRAGTEKALATPYEALSDKARQGLEARAQEMYDIFLNYAADCRGVSAAVADKNFGQGVDFLAEGAKKAGLIDEVGSFEDAFAAAVKLGDKKSRPAQGTINNGYVQAGADANLVSMADNHANSQGTHMPQPLSQEQIDAMAAGIELPVAEAAAPAAEVVPETPAQADAAPAAAAPDALTVLQSMLATAQAELLTARMEASTSKTELAALKLQAQGSIEIARASVKTMGLHFGMSADTHSAQHPSAHRKHPITHHVKRASSTCGKKSCR